MLTSLFILRCSIALGILLASNPATLSVWVILTAIAITCAVGLNTLNWFGLIIFLIYVGGILIIFSYFVVIQPNQQLEIKKIIAATFTTTLLLSILSTKFIKPLQRIRTQTPINPFLLILPKSITILLRIALILFIALVAVIKIAKINQGPLRPFSAKPN